MSIENELRLGRDSDDSGQPEGGTIAERRRRVAQMIGRLLARHWLRQRSENRDSNVSIAASQDGKRDQGA